MNKRVLVIVVTYNGMRWLDRCLGSVVSDADLYVWDNDSTDGSADFVAKNYPAATLVRSAENLGFSRPNNWGVEYAIKNGYDYVYFLNQDAWLDPGALQKMLAASEAHPDYAVLSPLQMTDGYQALDQNFAKCLPSCTKTAEFVPQPAENGNQLFEIPEVLEVKRIMAAHWLVPVWAWERVGAFNEELFPLYGQDDDWCNRARYCGLKIGVVLAARAVHDRAYRIEGIERLVSRNYYTGSLVRLANPNRALWLTWPYVFLFTLVKAVKYRSMLPFKYLRTILKQMPAVKASRMHEVHAR